MRVGLLGLEDPLRAGQPTPVFLSGGSDGERSLAGYSPSRYLWSIFLYLNAFESYFGFYRTNLVESSLWQLKSVGGRAMTELGGAVHVCICMCACGQETGHLSGQVGEVGGG